MTGVAFANLLIVNSILGGVVGNTTEFSSGNDRSATGNSVLLVYTELSHLLTDLIFAVGAIFAQTLCLISCLAFYISALILLWSPVAITEMVSVAGNPCMHAIRARLVSWVEVGALLILTVEGDFRSLRQFFTLGMVLNDFPVLLD